MENVAFGFGISPATLRFIAPHPIRVWISLPCSTIYLPMKTRRVLPA